MDLQQEGEGETTHNPTDDTVDDDDIKDRESSSDIPPNQLIQSNINNVTDDGKDSDSDVSDDEDEQDGYNETSTNTPSKNNTTDKPKNKNKIKNKNKNHNENNINNNPNRHISNINFNTYNVPCIIIVLFIAIYIRYQSNIVGDLPENIPICSRNPDPSIKYKLECPKCDAYDNTGKCIIYVPYSSEQYTLNAKGSNNELNNYECTNFQWDLESNYVLASGEDTSLLDMTFISPGRENIELTIYINRTDYVTGQLKYYKEKTCDLIIVIYEAPYFGIDLGTTYSCIAYQKPYINRTTGKRDTNIVVMDQTKMEYCIPSSVYFTSGKNNKRKLYIGNKAQNMAYINNDYNNLIYDIKRIIGRPSDDPSLKQFITTHQFKLNMTSKYPKIIISNWNNTNITPEQLMSIILIELVQSASEQFGIPLLKDVVVSIPAIFHDAQRKAVHSACAIAGLNAKLLVVEPSAASIAHIYYSKIEELRQHNTEFNKYFMTLDIGGGTTDVSVLRCTGLHCQVLGVAGNSSLGGIDFDNVIVDIIVGKLSKKYGLKNEYFIEKNMQLYEEIISKSESIKIGLSNEDQIMIRLGNNNEQLIINKYEFETHFKTIELIENIINLVNKAMFDDNPLSSKKGNEKLSNIRAILLIGGTVKIPIIQKRLMDSFINKYRNIELIYPLTDPQLMVVKGSAIIGGSMAYTDDINSNILLNQIPNIIIDDVLPMSFGFDVCIIDLTQEDGHKCGIMDILIKKNSKYPTKGEGIYCQKLPTSNTATLMLYEGDNQQVKYNFFLTKLEILNVPNRSEYECNNIKVELIIDENGIVNITAKTNNQVFSKELPIMQSNNYGHFTDQQIKVLNKQVMEWFHG